ncbi:hypothetical protein [Amycolatopsis sp. lyj-23]|uniref:hypothetical protein n=1 Tax=Amycolatopsis sp. lyj-23 TaxID=2789283 RepID=UPI00397AE9B0
MSKRIDDGTKVSDTSPKHKHHSPVAAIRRLFDNGRLRRKRRNLLLVVLSAAQRD